jgi:hypothetical protein
LNKLELDFWYDPLGHRAFSCLDDRVQHFTDGFLILSMHLLAAKPAPIGLAALTGRIACTGRIIKFMPAMMTRGFQPNPPNQPWCYPWCLCGVSGTRLQIQTTNAQTRCWRYLPSHNLHPTILRCSIRRNGAYSALLLGGTLTCTVKHRELESAPLGFKGVACSPNSEAWAAFT